MEVKTLLDDKVVDTRTVKENESNVGVDISGNGSHKVTIHVGSSVRTKDINFDTSDSTIEIK